MKQILFRAIDEFSDEFIIWQSFFIDSDNDQGYIADGISDHHPVKKETVGQFIGLLDKNGNMIFDGDILDNSLVIKWNNLHNCWGYFSKNGFKSEILSEHQDEKGNFIHAHINKKIIGNIHQNPELLK